jgi:hypothetical protein
MHTRIPTPSWELVVTPTGVGGSTAGRLYATAVAVAVAIAVSGSFQYTISAVNTRAHVHAGVQAGVLLPRLVVAPLCRQRTLRLLQLQRDVMVRSLESPVVSKHLLLRYAHLCLLPLVRLRFLLKQFRRFKQLGSFALSLRVLALIWGQIRSRIRISQCSYICIRRIY